MEGWISIHRKILDNDFCKESAEKLGFWTTLLLLASHKDNKFYLGNSKIECREGSFITGRKKLSKIMGVSEMKCERWLKCLENEQQIEQQASNKYRTIIILKWKEYQKIEQQKEQQVNSKGTASEQQVNTINNDNNDNNIYNNIINSKQGLQINELINIFKEVNPIMNFGNKTQRKAIEELLKLFDYEKLKSMIEITVKHQGKEFMPTVTTPCQFKDKLGAIKIYFERLKTKTNKFNITSI